MKNCLKPFRTGTKEDIECEGILGYDMGVLWMYDLKKLEKKFHEFIHVDEYPDREEIRITEDLLERQEALYIPFGEMRYFLVIEDEKPVLYVHAISRMDLNSICFIDEDGYRCYDIFMGENKEMYDKYRRGRRGVKMPDRLKGIPKMEE